MRGNGFAGDIAIDDFSLVAGSCGGGITPPPPTNLPTTNPPKTPSGKRMSVDLNLRFTMTSEPD